ncbi:MAG: radical SAM protein [Candidatus Nanoarchaeia archaeon]|nr:radical SAM protein [Candidatus Nanoarchaeia archaeon]
MWEKNQRILLVGPYKKSELRIGQFLAPPLGIYRLKSYIEKNSNYLVDIIDLDLKGENYFFEKIKNNNYSIIGFSLLQPTLKNDLPLINKVKNLCPESILIAGGQGAVFNHELLFNKTPLTAVIKGFGEFTLLELLKNNSWEKIKGLYLKKGSKIIDTGFIPEFTPEQFREVSIGFDFEKVPYEEYWNFMEQYYTYDHLELMKNQNMLHTIRIMTSSHCPRKCVFCSSTNFLDNSCKIQKRLALNADEIYSLILNAIKAHPKCKAIYFNDDDFLFDKERIIKLCSNLKNINGISFFCLSRIDNYDEKMISLMKSVGFKFIIYGVESFSNNVLNQMNKNIPSNYSKIVIKKTIDQGIDPLMNLILFYPTTKIEEIIETIENSVDLVDYGARLNVYPYIEFYAGAKMMEKNNYEFIDEEFNAGNEKITLHSLVLPINETIKNLAKKSVELRNELLTKVLDDYGWKGPCPHPLYGLSLFLAVYKILNKDTVRIEKTINNIMEEVNKKMKIPQGFKTIEEYNFPNIVNVCVLKGTCPCKCIHCPVGLLPAQERKTVFGEGTISMVLFKKIVDEMKNFKNSALRLHSVGEPLVWEEIIEALKYSRQNGVKTWLFTSLVTDNKKLIEGLASYCDIIEVSVNGFDSENYRNLKGIDAFELVYENMKHLSNYIKNNNLSSRILASRVESEDKDYDKSFLDFWKSSGLVNDCFIRSFHDYNGAIKGLTNEARKIVPCHVHWSRFNIDMNGRAIICFNELFKQGGCDESLVLGDVSKDSIQNIWKSEKLSLIRRAQVEDNYDLIKFTAKLPCVDCKYCQPLDTKMVTSEYQIKKLGADF